MISIINKTGPGISSLRIQVDESEYYKRSPAVMLPIEVRPPNWLKFGEKNTEIDLIDPFINAYGNAFDGDIYAPFESNYPHLIGTVWIEPDFMGTGDDKERSIQDYIDINLMCDAFVEKDVEDLKDDDIIVRYLDNGKVLVQETFKLRDGVMLRPVNRDGIMMFDIGLGPEDAFLMGLACKLNLSFDISYNAYDIYNDTRDVTIYLLDLRLEKNPSSSTPDTLWSIYDDGFSDNLDLLDITVDLDSVSTADSNLTLGGIQNGEIYGIEIDFTYDNETSEYSIDTDSALLTLFNLSQIEPMAITGIKNKTDHEFTDWTVPYSSSNDLQEQSTIAFGTDEPDLGSEFTVIYNFTFNFNNNKDYGVIKLGPNEGNNVNVSWVEFDSKESWIGPDLKESFLPASEDSISFMFGRYNQTITGDGVTKSFSLDYTINNVPEFNNSYFVIYNEEELPSIKSKALNGSGYPRINFTDPPNNGQKVNVIYGVRSQYELGYGFQKIDKPYSDSIRLIYNNDGVQPIKDSSGDKGTYDLEDSSLYIGLDNSPTETILELYDIPLLYGPELNCTFVLDPVIMDQINNTQVTDINTLSIKFYFAATGSYGSYYTDSNEVPLNYTDMQPDLESGSYLIHYNKDLQSIFDAFGFGSSSIAPEPTYIYDDDGNIIGQSRQPSSQPIISSGLDIYISISQVGNNPNFIPYIIFEQFDYLCDEHFVEMYSRMPLDKERDLDVSAVINTPHYFQILSRPFIDGTGYGDSPFDLLNGSEITVALEGLPYSSLVALDGSSGDYRFNYLGTMETLPINAENYYMIPNLALFTDVYNTDEVIYQDGFVNLYYGSGTEVKGEHDYFKRIYMDYKGSGVDDYESSVNGSGIPDSWEDMFNITDQFLSTQEIRVSGSVLYHQLFDLTTDYIDNSELENILDDITGVYFGVQIPDEVSIAHIRTVGEPYAYDLSIQGFPIGDYVDDTYCKIVPSGEVSRNFDERAEDDIMNSTVDYSLEFASNGSKYIVFYQPLTTVDNYSLNNKIMVDYWAYHTFAEGFDYEITEDPLDPYVTTLDWDYEINSLTSFDMHPDFSIDTSFTVEFSALEWSSIDNNYLHNGDDTFTFQPIVKSNLSVMYYGDANESFSILNIVPDNQFNDTNIFKEVYVEIWNNSDVSTVELYKMVNDPIIYSYIFQDENCSFYYWINFTKIQEHLNGERPGYVIVPDSYAFIEVHFISSQLKYPLSHTPFNYDYVGTEHTAYHIKLSIEGKDPIYSYQTSEFNKYVLKIEDNYIYFNDKSYGEDGYIANKSKITLEYKFKLQPGLIDQEHFLMVIYPWTNVFNTLFEGVLSSSDGTDVYRERYRKISGSSIISPFEYSLSIDDVYSLYLSYRLNQREIIETKFEIDYRNGELEFYYLQDELTPYILEFDETDFYVYYYDIYGVKKELDNTHYSITTSEHKITLHDDNNPIVEPNDISEFYVVFTPRPTDYLLPSYQYTYDPSLNMSDTLMLTNWEVVDGEQFDVIPNFNAHYYLDTSVCTFKNFVGYATQIASFLEQDEKLRFNLANELPIDTIDDIQDGLYCSLYIHTAIENYEYLDSLTVELINNSGVMPEFITVLSQEELELWDFNIKVDLPTSNNTLQSIQFTPNFRDDNEYSNDNTIGVAHFEFIEWDEGTTSYDNNGNLIFMHLLENHLLTNNPPLEIAYMFNDELQYLQLPQGVAFNWSIETDPFDREVYFIHIPSLFIDPDDLSKTCTFEDGDIIVLRYNTPVEKAIQLGVEKMYFNKKPYDYNSLPVFAECLLINTSDSSAYSEFTTPYNYNITLPLTPFDTEYSGTYMDVLLDINLTTLQQFAVNGSIDFSYLVFSVPNPAYELTIHEVAIIQESQGLSDFADTIYNRIWQYSNRVEFTSSETPEDDQYLFTFTAEEIPLFYNDAEEGKWLEYVKIYDENYNYYSAGISGDEYQLHWNSTTGNFTWNDGFDKFQDYWGMQIELPAICDANTTLYFDYCTNDSWSIPIDLQFENIDAYSIDLSYNYDYLLTPHYEEWYGDIDINDNFDNEIVQYYSESFIVYDNSSTVSYTFETEYDLINDFTNLTLFSIVGTHPNFTHTTLKNDSINYEIDFDIANKNITITDLESNDGLFNQFDLITVILNYTSGPISSKTQIFLSSEFNQTYISDIETTFYDYVSCSFEYSAKEPIILLAESEQYLISDFSSFISIDYTRNTHLSADNSLNGYETRAYINFDIFEDPYNTIYEADLDFDGEVDYKQEIDINKDNRIDIVRYGVEDSEVAGEVIWYRIIQDFEATAKEYSMSQEEEQQTRWFDIDEDLEFEDYNLYAMRIIQKELISETTTYTKFYSVRIDEDLDGYADTQVSYQKVIQVVNYTTSIIENTITAGLPYTPTWCDWDGVWRYQYSWVFSDSLKPECFETKIFPEGISNDHQLTLLATYSQYRYITNIHRSDEVTTEKITFTDFEEGEISQIREYSDNFVNDLSLFNSEPDITSLSITHTDTELQRNATLPLFALTDPTQINWTTETWGDDNIPLKFDTLTTIIDENNINTENHFEEAIRIRINSKYSLYHDYLEIGDSERYTLFDVEGIFITPSDGMVFYTSDKRAYYSHNHENAKTRGHYLYYDSDSNGFYETIFILRPDEDGDEIYDVICIAYNYDGKHEFVPYEILKPNFKFISVDQTKEIVVGGIQVDINTPFVLDAIYPKDASDSFVARDHIFEIYRLTDPADFGMSFFLDVYNQRYGEAWAIYEDRFWADVMSQVGMIVRAGIISGMTAYLLALTTSMGSTGIGVIAALIFAPIYFILSWEEQEQKRYFYEQQTKARTYYTANSDRSLPTILSDKRAGEADGEWEHYLGHPAAKYLPVSGGVPGNMYSGKVIVYPPEGLRSYVPLSIDADTASNSQTVLDIIKNFEHIMEVSGTNLDYFLLTSELPSYYDKPYYSFSYDSGRSLYYLYYRYNTIGYLEREVDIASDGEFNAMKPICINGRPGYVFTNTEKEKALDRYTKPLNPLYQPIVISQDRYNDDDIVPDAVISVDVKCADLDADSTLGIDTYELIFSETRQEYKNKIPLHSPEFHYPITKISIDVVSQASLDELIAIAWDYLDFDYGMTPEMLFSNINTVDELILLLRIFASEAIPIVMEAYEQVLYSDLIVDSKNYLIDKSDLYFYNTIDSIVKSQLDLDDTITSLGDRILFYRVKIHIAIVVPDTMSIPRSPQDYYMQRYLKITPLVGDEFEHEYEYRDTEVVLDTSSNDLAKAALAQAVQYSISEYFGIYAFASSVAQSQADMDYIVYTTLMSTFISSLVLLPFAVATAYAAGSRAGSEVALSAIIGQKFALIPLAMVTEVFEELYIDTLIEDITENIVYSLGGDERTAAFWSSFICSFREAFMGPVSILLDSDQSFFQKLEGELESTIEIEQDIREEMSLVEATEIEINNVYQRLEFIQEKDAENRKKRKKLSWRSLLSFENLFTITLMIPGMFAGGLGLGITSILGDFMSEHYFQNSLGRKQLDEQHVQLVNTKGALEIKSKILRGLYLNLKSVPSNPLLKSSSLASRTHEAQVETLASLNIISRDVLRQRQEVIKENLDRLDGKVNSESDSNENSFEIFVAEAAEQADPVVEENGMRIWIQPLRPEDYNLENGMTLDDFLDLIGVLNDPARQAVFNGYILQEGTEIFTQQGIIRLDGNMPLSEALDLIGYDRNNLEQQFHGTAPCIQIIDTTTLLQLQDDTKALFHPNVREEIFYRHGVTDFHRISFSEKLTDVFNVFKLRIQDTFRETIHESVYNIIKTRYSEDFGITQEEWLELVDSKAKDENGASTQEFEKIVDLCLKEQVFLNLIELSGGKDQDVNAIFSTLDAYLDDNFGSLIEQLFAPLTFEAFISDVVNQFLNNIENEGFVSFNVATHEYFEDLISTQDSYKDELVLVYWGSPPPPEFKKDAFIESNYKAELDALSLLFYRIREYLIDQNNRDLPITYTLLGLHGPKDPGTYTRLYLTDVFKDLGLIDDNILQNMHLTQKSFYKTLLQQIQLDIQNNPDSSKFMDYSFLTGMQFSQDEFFDDGDQQIVKFIDDIMNKEIGYVGYTLLKLDLIRFDGNGQIMFQIPQDLTTLAKIIRVLGLNSIAELKTSEISIMEYLETLIWSMILSGNYMNLMTIDNNGQVELREEYTYPGHHFLSGIFENFMGNIPDSIYHLSIIWNFINSPFITDRFEVFQRIEQARNPLFYAGMEQKLRDLHIPQQVGNRIIWQEYELIGGTDTFQIEETIMDQNGFYHSTGNLMDPFYIWLKYGDTEEGFLHIDEDHGKEHFEDEWNLMSDREKSDFILGTISNQIGYRIRDNLILYQVHINNRIDYLCVAFSQDFHFIITAYQLKPELRQIYANLFS